MSSLLDNHLGRGAGLPKETHPGAYIREEFNSAAGEGPWRCIWVQGRHPRGPLALLKDLQLALLSGWSGQRGGHVPSLGHSAVPGSGFHSLHCLSSSACSEISSPIRPTGLWSCWEIPPLPHPCHHNTELTPAMENVPAGVGGRGC